MAKNYLLLPEAVIMFTQTETLKEKDMSKNLVSGEFDGEFRSRRVKSGSRRQVLLVSLAVVVGVLALWLLVLTVVRGLQISRLQHEVDQLTANMIAMNANVKSLNQKITSSNQFNEFRNLEDTIYADDDQESTIPVEDEEQMKTKPSYESLNKLQGLTVLEDEDEMTDDEDYDGDDDDDAESGDWYPDYDKRKEKVGTTNMVRLKPDDFEGSVVTFVKDKQQGGSMIREIKRMLNENPENPDIALPALPTSTGSTLKTKLLSTTDSSGNRRRRSVTPDNGDEYAAPMFVANSDERRKNKKYVPHGESTFPGKLALHTISRTARNSDEDGGRKRPFIAAHFHGNTSHLHIETHEHYKGNGLVRVSHGAPHDVWYPSQWTINSPHPRPTLTRNGHIHIHHTGVYLVYVQIYYLDTHDIISWVLHRTNPEVDGRETILQCAQSSHSTERLEKPNSCFSASALFLKAGDKLAVRNTGGDRHSLMQPEKSFIGLVKLADAEDPNDEF